MRKLVMAFALAIGVIFSVGNVAKAATVQDLGTLGFGNTNVAFQNNKLSAAGTGTFVYAFSLSDPIIDAVSSVTASSTLGVQSLVHFTFSLYQGVFGGASTLLSSVTEADASVSPSGKTEVELDFANILKNGAYYLLLDVTSGKKNAVISGNIDVAPVPVPAALPMFGAVLVGLVAFQARRRNRLAA